MNNGRQRLVEDWSGDEDDTSFFIELRGGDVDSQQSPWCRKCSASGRMSGLERESWSRSGYCENMGCPGYSGHPPASRPQGEEHDDSSDDVPLLFSATSPTLQLHSSQEMELVDHCHCKAPRRDSSMKAKRQLCMATVLCSIFVAGEVVGGYLSGSLAIMGDAAHMFSDLASFGVSLLVLWISDRKATKAMTFGYHRAEALGALATLCIIWYVTGILVYLAVRRIHDQDFEIHDTTMLIVASAAVAFNILLGFTLHGACGHLHGHNHSHGLGGHSHHSHHSHHADGGEEGRHNSESDVSRQINIRAALIHVLGDLLQSIGVLISSLLIKFFGESYKIADPICTLIFAVIVICTTFTVLRDTLSILLEGTPSSVNYDTIYSDLLGFPDVVSAHSLHLWSLTADIPVISVHLTTKPESDHQKIRADINRLLRSKHKIFRTTIQIETHNSQVLSSCENCQPLLK